MTQGTKRRLRLGLLFVSPWLIGLSVFNLFPVVMSVYYSLSDFSVLRPPVFIGTANYTNLFYDAIFWKSLTNTLIYAAMALPLGTILAVALALLLNARIVARPVFRTIFFIPSLVPLVALAILWRWMFNAQYGVLNYTLEAVGIRGPNWLGDPTWSKPAIVITGLWGVGNAVVIYLASLQDVPRELYEAAEIDGASWWQKTWNVTIPMISPAIYFNVIMSCITVLQIFIVPYIMTPDGSPARSTLFYAMYLFNKAFRDLDMGYACALAWVLFVFIAGLTYAAHYVSKERVHYHGK